MDKKIKFMLVIAVFSLLMGLLIVFLYSLDRPKEMNKVEDPKINRVAPPTLLVEKTITETIQPEQRKLIPGKEKPQKKELEKDFIPNPGPGKNEMAIALRHSFGGSGYGKIMTMERAYAKSKLVPDPELLYIPTGYEPYGAYVKKFPEMETMAMCYTPDLVIRVTDGPIMAEDNRQIEAFAGEMTGTSGLSNTSDSGEPAQNIKIFKAPDFVKVSYNNREYIVRDAYTMEGSVLGSIQEPAEVTYKFSAKNRRKEMTVFSWQLSREQLLAVAASAINALE